MGVGCRYVVTICPDARSPVMKGGEGGVTRDVGGEGREGRGLDAVRASGV